MIALASTDKMTYIMSPQCHHVVDIEGFVAHLMRVSLRERANADACVVRGMASRTRCRIGRDHARGVAAVACACGT